MAATINTNTITNLPEVWASDDSREQKYQFRSIERTGYLTVTELVRDFLADAANEAALTIVNVAITETHMSTYAQRTAAGIENFIQYTQVDPTQPKFLSQRIRKITSMGAGYNVDDELVHYVVGARANVKIKVTSVDTDGVKGITGFTVLNSGEYNTSVNPMGTNKLFEFRRRVNPKATMTLNKDYSYEEDTAGNDFYFQSRHEGNGWPKIGGVGGLHQEGPTVVPSYKGPILSTATAAASLPTMIWSLSFGWDRSQTSGSVQTLGPDINQPPGRGGPSDLKSLSVYTFTSSVAQSTTALASGSGTRWPVDGIWANIKPQNNSQIFPGSEILLKPGFANAESYIPPGTIITKVDEIEVVDGLIATSSGSPVSYQFYEKTGKYIYMTLSGNVKIDKGDAFYTRGNGALFSDNTTTGDTAEIFQVVCEATERIDPLAAGRAQVSATLQTLNGTSVRLTNITHGKTAWAPTIFEGALITSGAGIDLGGATVANVANIQYSMTAGQTTANIVTDIPLPTSLNAAVNKTLTFDLPTGQPWRLAFMANGKQTLAVAVGTAVQLRNDANVKVARIADYTGGINDITGYVGDVPSKVTLSTTDKFTSSAGSIGGPTDNTTIINGKTGYPKTGGNILTITTMTPTDTVYPGYYLDMSTIGGALNGQAIKGTQIKEQILPLATGEKLNNVGRYYVTKNYVTAATIAYTSTTWAKVIDRDIDSSNLSEGFINRSVRVSQYPEAYPLSYYVTFAKQGMFFGVWEGSWSIMQKSRKRQINEGDAWFNWFIVQRPVNRKTGMVRTSGQSPVFCINSVGYKYWKFIVRERDVMHPTQGDAETFYYATDELTGNVTTISTPFRTPADQHTEDSHALLNTTAQIALTEDSKYLVSFLYNLTTPRFRYSDELDLIGQTAADVAMASSDVKITAYNEPTQRVYKSLAANLPYNAGLRICVLKDIYVS